jgi:hypothetical protein
MTHTAYAAGAQQTTKSTPPNTAKYVQQFGHAVQKAIL